MNTENEQKNEQKKMGLDDGLLPTTSDAAWPIVGVESGKTSLGTTTKTGRS